MKSKIFRQIVALLITFIMILPVNMPVFAGDSLEVVKVYASPRAVTVQFSGDATNAVVSIDDEQLTRTSKSTDGKTCVYSTEELAFDKWYKLDVKIEGQEIFAKAIRLKKLLYDDFNDNADSFSAPYDSETKTMLLPRARTIYAIYKYYVGINDANWKDYRVDIKLANDVNSSHYRLHLDTYLQGNNDNKGVGFGIAAYGAYRNGDNSRRYDWFEQVYKKSSYRGASTIDNAMYAIAGGDATQEVDSSAEYLHYIGLGNTYRKSKDDIISFDVSKNTQAILLNDEIRKVTNIDAENEYGGFAIYNFSTTGNYNSEDYTQSENPANIKEIAVYKLEQKDLSEVHHIESAVITPNGNSLNLTYNIAVPDGQSDAGATIEWYSCPIDGDTYTKIDGQTSSVLPLTGYEDKLIKAVVIPNDGLGGVGLLKNAYYFPQLRPEAKTVSILGIPAPRAILEADYTYFDYNGDAEDLTKTEIKWYVCDTEDGDYGDPIATGENFSINENYYDKYIKVGVKPYSLAEPIDGVEKLSDAVYIRDFLRPNVENIYVSPKGVSVEYSEDGTESVVSIDGVTLTRTSQSADGKNCVYVTEGLEFDKWYNLCITHTGKITYNKAIRLNTLLYDNFEDNADSFSAPYDPETKTMLLPRTRNAYSIYKYYVGINDANWKDYRVDIKLANAVDSSLFRLHLDTYLQSKTENKGVGFGIAAYNAYKRFDWFEQAYKTSSFRGLNAINDDMYKIAGGDLSFEKNSDTEYLHYIGNGKSYRKSTDDVMSFFVSKNKQAIILNDEVRKETSIDADNEYGGFAIYNYSATGTYNEDDYTKSDNPINVKEIAVYKLEKKNISEVYSVHNVTITKDDNNLNVAYEIDVPEGKTNQGANVEWYSRTTDSADYIKIEGQTSNTLSLTGLEDTLIKVVVTPNDDLGGLGTGGSDLYIPLLPPRIDEIRIDGTPTLGNDLSVWYKYFDFNGDAEDKNLTEINWYASDTKNGPFTNKIGEGPTLRITEAHYHKYIKVGVKPYSAEAPNEALEETLSDYVYVKDLTKPNVEEIYVSPRNVSIKYSLYAEDCSVMLDGKKLTRTSMSRDGLTCVYNTDGLDFDKWYTIKVLSDNTVMYEKTVKLTKLLYDDFEEDVDGWVNGEHDPDGYLRLNKNWDNLNTPAKIYHESFNDVQQAWSDYRIDVKLANSVTDLFGLYVEAYETNLDDMTGGFGYSFRDYGGEAWFEMMYQKYSDRPDMVNGQHNHQKLYDILYNGAETIDDEGAYLNFYHRDSFIKDSNIVSFIADADSQTIMVGDSIRKTKNMNGGTNGGFLMFNKTDARGVSVKIDEITVYKVEQKDTYEMYSAKDVTITKADNSLNLTYNIDVPEGGENYGAVVNWYSCDIDSNDNYTLIEGQTTSTLSLTGLENKLVKAIVKPNDGLGGFGNEDSDIFIPEGLRPTVKDVKITGIPEADKELQAGYKYWDYNDANGADNKDRVDVKWYVSASKDGVYSEVGSGEKLSLEQYAGKWVKVGVKPYSKVAPAEGNEILSAPVYVNASAVQDLYVSPESITLKLSKVATNVQVSISDKALKQVSLTDGEYLFATEGLEFDRWYNLKIVADGKTVYEKAVMLEKLLTDDFEDGVTGWVGGLSDGEGNLVIPESAANARVNVYHEKLTTDQRTWQDYRVDLTFANTTREGFRFYLDAYRPDTSKDAGVGFSIREYFTSGPEWFELIFRSGRRPDYPYEDDLYNKVVYDDDTRYMKYYSSASPLGVSPKVSFIMSEKSQVLMYGDSIRKKTNIRSEHSNGGFIMYNSESNRGVDAKIDKIAVYKFKESAASDKYKIDNIALTLQGGNAALKVTYNLPEGQTDYGVNVEWYSCDADRDKFTIIEGQSGETLALTGYESKIIKAVVTPKENAEGTLFGMSGYATYVPELPPFAENVEITGSLVYGEKLTGIYTFVDKNDDDTEQGTVSGWEYALSESDAEAGIYRPLNSSNDVVINSNIAGKYLRFYVTPKSSDGTSGSTVYTNPIYVYHAPVLNNLSINQIIEGIYGADYQLSSADGLAEGKTTFKWYVNDALVSTEETIEFSGSGTIKLEIVPVSEYTSEDGEVLSVTGLTQTIITTAFGGSIDNGIGGGTGGGTGGGAGGAAGGGIAGGGVPPVIQDSIDDMTSAPEDKISITDMANHWAKKSAAFAFMNNIMTLTEKNNFIPELPVSRYEFLIYILKATNKSEATYSNTFKDVSSKDWYSGYVASALENRIISVDELFNPFRPVSREEMCKMIVQAMNIKTVDNANVSDFTDSSNISDWAVPYVATVVQKGLLMGNEDGNFEPKAYVTRAQVATIIERIMKK